MLKRLDGSPESNGDGHGGNSQNAFAPQDEQKEVKIIDPALTDVGMDVGIGAVGSASSQRAIPIPDVASGLILPNRSTPQPPPPGSGHPRAIVPDE